MYNTKLRPQHQLPATTACSVCFRDDVSCAYFTILCVNSECIASLHPESTEQTHLLQLHTKLIS